MVLRVKRFCYALFQAMKFLAFFCLILTSSIAQDVQQCVCTEFEPCAAKYEKALKPCIEACSDTLHVDQQGVNVAEVKTCLEQNEQMITAAFTCFKGDHKDACARGDPKTVEKRYTETLRFAAIAELHNMVDAGAMNKVGPLISLAKRMSTCVEKCMNKAAGSCYKELNCGLDLASDSILIQEAKDCAVKSGFDTAALQGLCECISKSGITSLQGVCEKIHT